MSLPKVLFLGYDLVAEGIVSAIPVQTSMKGFGRGKLTPNNFSIKCKNTDDFFSIDNPNSILNNIKWLYEDIQVYNEDNILTFDGIVSDLKRDHKQKIATLQCKDKIFQNRKTPISYRSSAFETPAAAAINIFTQESFTNYNSTSFTSSDSLLTSLGIKVKCDFQKEDNLSLFQIIEKLGMYAGADVWMHLNNINMQRLKNNRIIYNNWTIIKHMNKYINWVPNKLINNNRVNSLLTSSIETGQFTNYGPNVQLLEKIIREKLQIDNSKAVIVVSNGSVALHSLASSIEYYHNKKINWATQSFTFPPSAQGTLKDVKIVDIDKDGGLNLEELDNSINGIIVTNIFGNVVDIKKYEKWASDNNKFLIFDNAATPYTFYNGKSCCNYGNGCTISFHHTKPLGFGEGGAIIVDKKYENNIRCLNNFGIKLTDKYWVNEGNNYKMSDISAVYIIQYLDNFNKIIEKHLVLYDYFKKQIIEKKLPLKLFPSFHDDKKIMPSCFCLLFDESEKSYKIEKKLLEYNIFCRKYYNPLKNTKNTLEIYNKILCLPCNVDMDVNDIDYIINIILK